MVFMELIVVVVMMAEVVMEVLVLWGLEGELEMLRWWWWYWWR